MVCLSMARNADVAIAAGATLKSPLVANERSAISAHAAHSVHSVQVTKGAYNPIPARCQFRSLGWV